MSERWSRDAAGSEPPKHGIAQENPVTRAAREACEVLQRQALVVSDQALYPEASVTALISAGLHRLVFQSDQADLGTVEHRWATYVHVVRLLAAACPSTALLYVMHSQANVQLQQLPPSPFRTALVDQAVRGAATGVIAISESALDPLRYRGIGSGYLLTGAKLHVTGIHHADFIVVWITGSLRQSPEAFVLSADQPGVVISPDRWSALGMRAQDSCPVRFENVEVAPWQVIPREQDPSDGPPLYIPHVLGFASVTYGTLEGLWAHVRAGWRQMRPRQALWPLIGHVEASMEACRLALDDAARQYDERSQLAPEACLAAKALVTDWAAEIADEVLQVGGTYFYERNVPHFHMLFTDLRGLLLLGPRNSQTYANLGRQVARAAERRPD